MSAERDLMVTTLSCPRCHAPGITLQVNRLDYERWKLGTLIQRALPYLSATERERLKTGLCDPCWDAITDIGDEGTE